MKPILDFVAVAVTAAETFSSAILVNTVEGGDCSGDEDFLLDIAEEAVERAGLTLDGNSRDRNKGNRDNGDRDELRGNGVFVIPLAEPLASQPIKTIDVAAAALVVVDAVVLTTSLVT